MAATARDTWELTSLVVVAVAGAASEHLGRPDGHRCARPRVPPRVTTTSSWTTGTGRHQVLVAARAVGAERGCQPLTAPAEIPFTICLPKIAVTMTSGTVAMTVPARMTEMSGV